MSDAGVPFTSDVAKWQAECPHERVNSNAKGFDVKCSRCGMKAKDMYRQANERAKAKREAEEAAAAELAPPEAVPTEQPALPPSVLTQAQRVRAGFEALTTEEFDALRRGAHR